MRAARRTPAPGARQTAQSMLSPFSSRSPLGARGARHARAGRAADSSADCPLPRVAHERSNATLPTNSGARVAPHARAGRAEGSSADCPELKRAKSLGWPDRDLPMRWRTHESRPNGRMLSMGFSASGPAPPSEPGQTRVSSRAPQAPRVRLSRAARADDSSADCPEPPRA